MSLFRCVVADPPWDYSNRGAVKIGVKYHYPTKGIEWLERLAIPVAEEAHLYLWVTNSFLPEGLRLVEAWGFKYKTMLTWAKLQKRNIFAKPNVGMGGWFRGATEHVMFGVRGKLKLTSRIVRSTLLLDRAEAHSIKPDWFFNIVQECSPGPRLEMFARRKRPGWSCWGNEVASDVQIGAR